jgi:DNA-binding IclR family transcriptional regulator
MTAPESWYATRTLRALEILAFRPCTAPEMADALLVHPRTARRLLNRLLADGYVTRTDGERRLYAPTLRVVALASQVAGRSALAWEAVPFVERLHRETGVSSHLCVPSYDSVLCLVHRTCADTVPLRPQMRELAPAHTTAAGRVLLAHRARWGASVLAKLGLDDPDELERIRRQGFATEEGSRAGVAAPVFGADGEAVAALAVTAPAERLDASALGAAARVVSGLALGLSQRLAG